jgi:glycosyltransferase involved in cell wall biosynthesis
MVPLGLPGFVDMPPVQLAPGAALLAVVNGPVLPPSLLRLPRGALKSRRVIGFWAWELPSVPPGWAEGAKFVHEIWAPSRFAAAALEPLAPGRVRAVPFPMAEIELPAEGSRAAFGLPEDVFIVTTIFNLASSLVRKNPLGAIAAFKAAFGNRRDYLFVLKLSHVGAYPEDVALIRAAIGDAPNILLRTDTVSESSLRGLIRVSDVVLSLHRAEGFGLIPATAMLLGRAVVATGWSGNMDFMSPEVSGLVPYRRIPAHDPRGTYELAGANWAEPDVEAAAALLRRLAEDESARNAMARAGQAHARAKLGAGALLAALAQAGIA